MGECTGFGKESVSADFEGLVGIMTQAEQRIYDGVKNTARQIESFTSARDALQGLQNLEKDLRQITRNMEAVKRSISDERIVDGVDKYAREIYNVGARAGRMRLELLSLIQKARNNLR